MFERSARWGRLGVVLAWSAADFARLRTERRLGASEQRLAKLQRRMADRLRKNLAGLRGIYIKAGQFLSLRNDVLPRVFCEQLSSLQDRVRPVPFRRLRPRIERELGPLNEVFAQLDPRPVAAASLGQVHFGVLRSGEPVALKIRYPGIRRTIDADLRNLRSLLGVARPWLGRVPLDSLLAQLRKGLEEELDYVHEAGNLEAFREVFGDRPDIVIPVVHAQHSTGALLCMQRLDGVRLGDLPALERAGVSGREAALLVVRFYTEQILKLGFFHADPHPGNFLILPEGPRLGVLDFGLVRRLRPLQVRGMRRLGLGFLGGDPQVVAQSFEEMGFGRDPEQNPDFLPFAGLFLEAAQRMLYARRKQVQLGELFAKLGDLAREQPGFQVPTEILLLGRVLSLLSGLGRKLRAGLQLDQVLFDELQKMSAAAVG